jgi:hypothetical protein
VGCGPAPFRGVSTLLINQTVQADNLALNQRNGRIEPFNVDFYTTHGIR